MNKKQKRLHQLKIRLESEKVTWSKHHKNCYGPSLKDLISKKETKAT